MFYFDIVEMSSTTDGMVCHSAVDV